MSKHDHVPSLLRPTLPSEILSRARASPLTGPAKRKVSAGSELTSEASKRARGSELASLTSVPDPAELEAAALPLTPRNKSFVKEPATPILPARFASATVNDKESGTLLSPIAPSKSTSDAPNAVPHAPAVTPPNISSSHVDPSCVNPSDSRSQTYRHPDVPTTLTRSQRSSRAVDSNMTTQVLEPEMEVLLKYELCGRVFQHNKFYDEFLPVDREIQTQVRNMIKIEPGSYLGVGKGDTWTIHEAISPQTDEKEVYDKLATMLNIIGRGAYGIYRARNEGEQFRQKYHPFLDHHNWAALWDSPSDAAMSPDLVMSSEQARAHWRNMQLIVEFKSNDDTANRNKAYLQLVRYVRAVFAYQIYRLHVFGFSLCGSIVNFVRFDRSGLLHSPAIDLSTPDGAHSFVQHVITLLTIDPKKFGYDTRYSFRQNDEQTKVDTLFKFPDYDAQVVNELICYRKCCCGRATCVCALGADVHKGIWRPEDRDDEGETLALFGGVFGVCQVKAFDYKTYTTRLEYPEALVESSSAYFFYPNPNKQSTAHISGPSKSSTRSKTGSRSSAPAKPCRSKAKEVPGPKPAASILRGVRVKSDILMPRGASLFDAQSPLHLVMAINDALLGIMAFTEAGKMYCDISAYNLLLINPKKHYGDKGWDKAPQVRPAIDMWNVNGKGTAFVPKDGDPTAEVTASQAAAFRLETISKLGRGPVCVVHDTEFTVDENRPRGEVHGDRTGTPAFISAQLLQGYLSASGPAKRTFMHDVESLLWILVWVVAHRSQDETTWKVNGIAKRLISDLSGNDYPHLIDKKLVLLSNYRELVSTISGLDNDWSEDLLPVIKALVDFIHAYLYFEPKPPKANHKSMNPQDFNPSIVLADPKVEDSVEPHRTYTNEPRLHTYARLLNIFMEEIATLEEKCPSIDLSRM